MAFTCNPSTQEPKLGKLSSKAAWPMWENQQGSGQTAQWLEALPEDMGLVPSTHVSCPTTDNSSSGFLIFLAITNVKACLESVSRYNISWVGGGQDSQ